MTLEII